MSDNSLSVMSSLVSEDSFSYMFANMNYLKARTPSLPHKWWDKASAKTF